MKVLLSIKPEFAELIFDGTKTYEFRKTVFKNPDIKTVVVYATSPVKKIVGEFEIKEVVKDSPEDLWTSTKHSAGISKDFFDEYFSGRNQACALAIASAKRYETPIEPSSIFDNFVAPQSFRYIEANIN